MRNRYSRFFLPLVLVVAVLGIAIAKDSRSNHRQISSDDSYHYHNVGNLGLTVTNFGLLGHGYNDAEKPSSQHKLRSNLLEEQVEHFSYAGVWIGGIKNGQKYVSTGIYDGVFTYDDGGLEFTTTDTTAFRYDEVFHHVNKVDKRWDFSGIDQGDVIFGGALRGKLENGWINFETAGWDTIITRSKIFDASGDPDSNPYASYARFFDPDAISHQDLICSFTDANTYVPISTPGIPIVIPNHQPLGVHVYQEAYSWYEEFIDNISIISYTVTNIPDSGEIADSAGSIRYNLSSGDSIIVHYEEGDTVWFGDAIEDPFFGIWVDGSVANMNWTSAYDNSGGPGGGFNWYDNLNTYNAERSLAMQYDFDGDAGWAQSYLGAQILGSDQADSTWNIYYHQWPWRGGDNTYTMPADEEERYDYMGNNPTLYTYDNLPDTEEDQKSWMMFISAGPLKDLAPGQRYTISLAIMAAPWAGGGPDGDIRRGNIYRTADWSRIIYNGEDRNGNGILDPGEDVNGDGELTRYIFPEGPPPPQLVVVPTNGNVDLYWNNVAEFAIDPISNKRDFEGYRVYGAPKHEGAGTEWALLAEFDADYDIDPTDDDSSEVGYNTGFSVIEMEQDTLIDGINVQYKWTNPGVLNGWPRELYYSVTAFDKGDPETNLPSLQSPINANRTYAFPGTIPSENDDERVSVYPNPYNAKAEWDGLTSRDRLIWFRHLPADCQVTIFNLAGERVDSFLHNSSTYTGSDVRRITQGESPGERRVFAGGEHAWDLLTADDQEIATGLYLFTVENFDNGDIKRGRFLVIK